MLSKNPDSGCCKKIPRRYHKRTKDARTALPNLTGRCTVPSNSIAPVRGHAAFARTDALPENKSNVVAPLYKRKEFSKVPLLPLDRWRMKEKGKTGKTSLLFAGSIVDKTGGFRDKANLFDRYRAGDGCRVGAQSQRLCVWRIGLRVRR